MLSEIKRDDSTYLEVTEFAFMIPLGEVMQLNEEEFSILITQRQNIKSYIKLEQASSRCLLYDQH